MKLIAEDKVLLEELCQQHDVNAVSMRVRVNEGRAKLTICNNLKII